MIQRENIVETKIPARLKKEPLLEVVWEIRFATTKPAVADLLPGLLFKAFPDFSTNVRLPAASLPSPLLEQDPNLRYTPKLRLEFGNQAIQVGERMVSLNCRRPYTGWRKFSKDIDRLAKTVRDTGLIDELERFSLKYLDLIELEPPLDLGFLNLSLQLGEHDIRVRPVQLRTEITEGNLFHIVQIVSHAEVLLPGETRPNKGVLLDIDTIRLLGGTGSWDDLNLYLDEAHRLSKKMFFSLLRQETLDALDPEYKG